MKPFNGTQSSTFTLLLGLVMSFSAQAGDPPPKKRYVPYCNFSQFELNHDGSFGKQIGKTQSVAVEAIKDRAGKPTLKTGIKGGSFRGDAYDYVASINTCKETTVEGWTDAILVSASGDCRAKLTSYLWNTKKAEVMECGVREEFLPLPKMNFENILKPFDYKKLLKESMRTMKRPQTRFEMIKKVGSLSEEERKLIEDYQNDLISIDEAIERYKELRKQKEAKSEAKK